MSTTPQRVLVQGASRGLGLTFATQLADAGARVFATARAPDESPGLQALAAQYASVTLIPLDVTRVDSIKAAIAEVSAATDGLDLVLNVAGVLNGLGKSPERRLEQIDPAAMAEAFAINAIGPILMAQQTLRLLSHGGRAVFASLSARIGSIDDNRKGGWYTCRSSKAAQNQLLRTLSIELTRRAPAVISVSLHPGTVDTEMSKPFQRGVPPAKLFSTDRAARQLLDIINGLTPDDHGTFIAWDGQPIPW